MAETERGAARRSWREPATSVVFRLRPGGDVQLVELRGDLVHWRHPLPMQRRDGGAYETTVALRPGVYSYKFCLADGHWLLDPSNGRYRTIDGVRNSLLVVGGTEEPVLHAPSPSWVFAEADGRVCVRAGLRTSAGRELGLRWDEGHGARTVPMDVRATEDDFTLLQAHLPLSARRAEYLFVLPDGGLVGAPGGAGQALSVEPSALRPPAPGWWRDAVVYTVFVDRFRRGGGGGPLVPLDPDVLSTGLCGGDLWGVADALPYLAELGVSVLHLTPIFVAASAHRYDIVEPRRAEPQVGGEIALGALLERAHAVGIRVLLDMVVTHVHRAYAPFQDVWARGPESPYWDWFLVRRFPFQEGWDRQPGYEHYQKGQWQEPLLNLAHPAVADEIVGWFEHWTRQGVDGFRLDATADVPLGLTERIAATVRRLNPAAVLLGEVTVDNLGRWTAHGLDAATDFSLQETLYDWLWRGSANATTAAHRWNHRRFCRGGPATAAVAFTATHDQPRFASLARDAATAPLAHLLVLLGPEAPLLYYGDEIGLRSAAPVQTFEGAWPDRMPMVWEREQRDEALFALHRQALQLRRQSAALGRGDARCFAPAAADGRGEDDLLCLRRMHGDEIVDVLVHAGEGIRRVVLPPAPGPDAQVALAWGHARLGAGLVELGPNAAVVLARGPASEERAAWADVLGRSLELGELAFVEAITEAVALPVRLYLTVTEACNLRCRHCLNRSPERTQQGQAREVRPWLLERLREPFAAADYFGFAHGGESLCSPMLFEVLSAIRTARINVSRRYDVHLLSNGMLLTPDETRRLYEHGVTSLAVSLDGASAATNDSLRVGSSLEQVVRNLRAAVELRTARGWDLRIGVSTVVTRSNVPELGELARLVADVGVDWLKLEEMCPVSGLCAAELVAPSDPRLREPLAEARELLAARGVVLVEHLEERDGCACQAQTDAALRAFRQADDFANRACFQPCRAPWQQACIDPNGDVHAVDYHHPTLGSLLTHSLFELWDGPVARRLREQALARVPEQQRASCPIRART